MHNSMKVKINNLQGNVRLVLSGELKTDDCIKTGKEIDAGLASVGKICSLVVDASELNYISSSGLRILLGLAKRFKDFRIVDTAPDIYRILEVTGFTKIMHVERAMRQMSVEGCEEIGRGGVGVVYRIDDDTIIKVFREGASIDELNTEVTMAKEAFVLGMPTAISFDVVRVGSQLGLVYELLRAETLSKLLRREPHRMDELARKYAALFHQLHSIEVPKNSIIQSAKAQMENAVRHIGRYFDNASIDLLLQMVSCIPDTNRLLHCDLQSKNAMMQGDELMLIDMGEVGFGHPVIDLGNSYSSMVSLLGDYETIIGLPQGLSSEFWMRMIGYYFEGEPADLVAHRLEQIKAVSAIRNFSWLALSDSFPDDVVRMCQDAFAERVLNKKDHLLEVCATLSDWTL